MRIVGVAHQLYQKRDILVGRPQRQAEKGVSLLLLPLRDVFYILSRCQ